MNKNLIIIFIIVLIALIIFILWFKNISLMIKSSNKSDQFIQILGENLFEVEEIFQNFQKDMNRFQNLINTTSTTSTQEILTDEEIQRLKEKIYEKEGRKTN